jgi:hypothetical protein
MYARGNPEAPTDEHASLLVSVAVSDSATAAVGEFQDAVAALEAKGADIASVDTVGQEAVTAEWTLYPDTDHPKTVGSVLFRSGSATVTVQWTDDPDQPVLDRALDVARALESQSPLG